MDRVKEIIALYENNVRDYGDASGDLSVKHVLTNETVIRRQVDIFNIYKEYLKDKNRFLDWGCKHAVDAYLIRKYLSDEVEIHGCDVTEERYGILYKEANLIYSRLTHPYKLPYNDKYFDVVISSGVLEHVPNDYESLKELYRIINNDGYLIITFLPNKLSYTESLNRLLNNRGHRRKYYLREIKKSLLHTGFVPITWGYHQVAPSLSSWSSSSEVGKIRRFKPLLSKIYDLNKYAEKVWPFNKIAANIFVIGQKKSSI